MARDHLDRYYTPAEALRPLITTLGLDGPRRLRLLEPCAGAGAISNPLRALGHEVTTADVDPSVSVDHYRSALDWTREELTTFDAVITNPPYATREVHCAQLVRHWLEHGAALVACLMRLSFLEPCQAKPGKKAKPGDRADLLTGRWTPAHVLVLPRVSYTGDGNTDNMTSCWVIWRQGHTGGIDASVWPRYGGAT